MPDIHAVKVIENGQEVLYNISDDVARNGHFIGDVYANANNDYSGGNKLPDETRVNQLIASAIGGISGLDIIIVNELPQVGSANTIYFVLTKQGNTGDYYDEYMYINSAWELIGTTQIDLSSKADKADTVLDTTLSRGREPNTTVGTASFAFGVDVEASAYASHAEGAFTTASGAQAHAEGYTSYAIGSSSHAEGYETSADGNSSHAEGSNTSSSGLSSHAEGYRTTASGVSSHAEGDWSEAEGDNSHAEGSNTSAVGDRSHAEGRQTTASGDDSHAEGAETTASGFQSHAEGGSTIASETNSHAEGGGTMASGAQAHAEGGGTVASGVNSHAEGGGTRATAWQAHAEGGGTVANGQNSHAEGVYTIAEGKNSHVGGAYNVADSYANWPEWTANTEYVVGDKVKVTSGNIVNGYVCTTYNTDSEFISSKWTNQDGRMNYAEIVGNGVDINTRSNARALDWDGNEYLAGDVYVNCGSDSTGGSKLPNESRVNQLIASAIGGISSLNIVILQALPQVGSSDTIYFILKTGSTNDLYDEYMYINNSWELIGTREIDISGKADKSEVPVEYGTGIGSVKSKSFEYNGNTYTSVASGRGSVAFGINSQATGFSSFVEGSSGIASGSNSHAEGSDTQASGNFSHAEGSTSVASGVSSHAQNFYTIANGLAMTAIGSANAESTEYPDWVANTHYLVGDKVVNRMFLIAYVCITENSDSSFTPSKWKRLPSTHDDAFTIGNGINNNNRSNALKVDWDGNVKTAGNVYVNCGSDSTGGTKLLKASDIPPIATIAQTQAIITEYAR